MIFRVRGLCRRRPRTAQNQTAIGLSREPRYLPTFQAAVDLVAERSSLPVEQEFKATDRFYAAGYRSTRRDGEFVAAISWRASLWIGRAHRTSALRRRSIHSDKNESNLILWIRTPTPPFKSAIGFICAPEL